MTRSINCLNSPSSPYFAYEAHGNWLNKSHASVQEELYVSIKFALTRDVFEPQYRDWRRLIGNRRDAIFCISADDSISRRLHILSE